MRLEQFFPVCCLIGLVTLQPAQGQPAAPGSAALKPESVSPALRPPMPKSPIESFRKLLAMDETAREKLLAGKSPQYRQGLEAKLKEFLALSANDRELRLKLLELRWYLAPLLKLAPSQRANGLAMVPEADRPLVEDRLKQWDQLPPDLQRSFLTNQMTLPYITRLEGVTLAEREAELQNLTTQQQQEIYEGLRQFQQLPPDKREKMLTHFKQFTELNAKEKDKVLRVLSESERQAMEKSLQVFQKLAKDQRAACIVGFRKFSNLPPADRQLFLQNAARWQEMSAQDRQAWRDLVHRVPDMPPLPPGLKFPPQPPGLKPGPTPLIASNNVAARMNQP